MDDGLRPGLRIYARYQLLTTWAPDFLREFIRRDGLAVERYFHAAAARAGELRSDRPTVPLLGTLFTPANNERLHNAVRYALERSANKPLIAEIQWIVPEVRWGHTRVLPATLNSIERLLFQCLREILNPDGSVRLR